jgi:signal transduction histidine kinase
VVPYSVAAHCRRREALIGLGLVLAGYAVYALENRDIMSGTADNEWAGAFFLVLAVGAWLAGRVVNGRRAAAALSARAAALEQEAALAAGEERARMARELHDIVSHNLSVVVVQAAGARAQQAADPSTLEKIERSGREALVEMRRLLGVLREDGDASLAPQPGIAQLPELVARVRAAGVPVELTIGDGCDGLPPAVDLSGYRIVQEALTNTLKHAGPRARAEVRIGRDAGALTIAVTDDGAGANGSAGGHGLVGIRERVALFGGELHAGPRPAGGFEIRARLPLP